jgi:hypothetical protein
MHKRATLADIAKDPDALTGLDIADLRALWALHFPKKPPSPNRGYLIRDLAWYAQAKFNGGFSNETRQLLQQAMNQAAVSRQHPKTAPAKIITPVKDKLMEGSMLIRHWNGRRHEVTVLDSGKRFQYNGKPYKSLSRIAEEITGAHWSGPRFFGLQKLG